jgi:transposase
MKKEILGIVDECVPKGITTKTVCSLLQISTHRVRRWQKRCNCLEDVKPGPVNAPHALLPLEREAILSLALDEEYVDCSHRVLAAKGADLDLFYASSSSVYKVMREDGLTADRSGNSQRNGKRMAPERPEIDGPNQRWCWDIS